MALTFPRTDILDGITFSAETPPFKPMWRQEVSRTANGVTLVKNMGPLLWQASYVTPPMTIAQAGEVEADLISLQGGVHLFEGYDPRHPLPASDKVSALTGVTVYNITAERNAIRFEGLPADFTISKGDWISIEKGDNLHLMKALETEMAGGSGISPHIDVAPYVHAAIEDGDPVTMRYPCARWMIEKDSVQRIPRGPMHDAISFTATQVIQ